MPPRAFPLRLSVRAPHTTLLYKLLRSSGLEPRWMVGSTRRSGVLPARGKLGPETSHQGGRRAALVGNEKKETRSGFSRSTSSYVPPLTLPRVTPRPASPCTRPQPGRGGPGRDPPPANLRAPRPPRTSTHITCGGGRAAHHPMRYARFPRSSRCPTPICRLGPSSASAGPGTRPNRRVSQYHQQGVETNRRAHRGKHHHPDHPEPRRPANDHRDKPSSGAIRRRRDRDASCAVDPRRRRRGCRPTCPATRLLNESAVDDPSSTQAPAW